MHHDIPNITAKTIIRDDRWMQEGKGLCFFCLDCQIEAGHGEQNLGFVLLELGSVGYLLQKCHCCHDSLLSTKMSMLVSVPNQPNTTLPSPSLKIKAK